MGMSTTLTIKTDKKLRDEAKRTAHELGIPLTTVVNAYLREFVRERSFHTQIDPAPTKKKTTSMGSDKRRDGYARF